MFGRSRLVAGGSSVLLHPAKLMTSRINEKPIMNFDLVYFIFIDSFRNCNATIIK